MIQGNPLILGEPSETGSPGRKGEPMYIGNPKSIGVSQGREETQSSQALAVNFMKPMEERQARRGREPKQNR